MTSGIDLIAFERDRQLEDEGYDSNHDDGHSRGALAWAAVCYAAPGPVYRHGWTHARRDNRVLPGVRVPNVDPSPWPTSIRFDDPWPWEAAADKRAGDLDDLDPLDQCQIRIRELTKAGALIAAEIDRLVRFSSRGVAYCPGCSKPEHGASDECDYEAADSPD